MAKCFPFLTPLAVGKRTRSPPTSYGKTGPVKIGVSFACKICERPNVRKDRTRLPLDLEWGRAGRLTSLSLPRNDVGRPIYRLVRAHGGVSPLNIQYIPGSFSAFRLRFKPTIDPLRASNGRYLKFSRRASGIMAMDGQAVAAALAAFERATNRKPRRFSVLCLEQAASRTGHGRQTAQPCHHTPYGAAMMAERARAKLPPIIARFPACRFGRNYFRGKGSIVRWPENTPGICASPAVNAGSATRQSMLQVARPCLPQHCCASSSNGLSCLAATNP